MCYLITMTAPSKLLCACFTLICLSGCGGGSATVSWDFRTGDFDFVVKKKEVKFDVNLKDTTEFTMDASLKRTYRATMSALKSMGLPILFRHDDERAALITSKFPDGDEIWVEIQSMAKNVCRVKVTLKGVGDELRVKMVVEKIKSNIHGSRAGMATYKK